jgi:aldose 1-epimerase
MTISVQPYGILPDGREVSCYTMENSSGFSASILDWGGTITNLLVPDKAGNRADVMLAHKDLAGYVENPGSFGALIGRNSNRIAGSKIVIAGKEYALTANNGANNLHGGPRGVKNRLFSAEVRTANNQPVLLLSLTIPDLDDEFPGNLNVNVAYAVTGDNSLMIDYRAVSDKDTVINMTNHAYFNLAGHNSGSILDHVLELDASFYTPAAADSVPTGELLSVEGTPFDFRTPKPIGKDIAADVEQLRMFGGYDHNLMLNGSGYRKVATLTEPKSGRVMTTFTDLPCIQLYSANKFPLPVTEKDNADYHNYQGLCLETQTCPNAAQTPWLVSPIYAAGQEYSTTTAYQFSNL